MKNSAVNTTILIYFWKLWLQKEYSVQDKAFQELEDIFQGEDRPATMKDLGEMKYLERCIKESLRLYPSVPFISRVLNGDLELGKFHTSPTAIIRERHATILIN